MSRSKGKHRKEREAPVEPEAAPPVKTARRTTLIVRAACTLVALATAVTVFSLRSSAPKPLVFPAPGEIRFFDTDPYYHVRHARYAAEHFPHLQRWDPALYPAGMPGFYVGLWDLALAGSAMVAAGGHATPEQVERASAWAPPVVGGLSILALFVLGWVMIGPIAGAAMALFLFLDPGLYASRALLGYPDHHVAEVFLGFLAVAGLGRCLQRQHATSPWWRPAVLHALPLSLFILTWFGAPIYLVLFSVALFLTATVDIARGAGGDAVGFGALRYALGLLVVLVPVRVVVPWLIMEEHFFRQTLVAIVLLGGGLPLYALAARKLVERKLSPPLVAALGLAAAAVLLAAGYYLAPQGRYLADQLLGVKTELVREQAGVDWRTYFYIGGTPAALAILAVPLALFDAGRGRDERHALPLILVGVLVVALWLRTHDYGYAASAYIAFLGGYAAVRIVLFFRGLVWRAVVATVLAVAAVLPVWYDKVVPPQRGTDHLGGLMIIDEGWVHALRWLRDHSPKPTHGIDTVIETGKGFHHGDGDYGVLAFWDFGHYIAEIAERLPLAQGGISGGVARWFLIEDENEAISPKAQGLGPGDTTRYVMVDARTAGDFFMAGLKMAHQELDDFRETWRTVRVEGSELRLWLFAKRYPRTMISKLYVGNGDGLAHFRLIYESPERSASYFTAAASPGGTSVTRRSTLIDPAHDKAWHQIAAAGKPAQTTNGLVYDVSISPTVKVFEIVPGAVLEGTADPGATVEITLELRAAAAKEVVRYHRAAAADETGHYLLTVAYPTDVTSDTDVVAASPYFIMSNGKSIGSARVPSAAVRAGSRVPVAR